MQRVALFNTMRKTPTYLASTIKTNGPKCAGRSFTSVWASSENDTNSSKWASIATLASVATAATLFGYAQINSDAKTVHCEGKGQQDPDKNKQSFVGSIVQGIKETIGIQPTEDKPSAPEIKETIGIQPTEDDSSAQLLNEDVVEADPTEEFKVEVYSGVPEMDESTSCLVCNVYRQGPCREAWRNFEYFVKDQEEKEGKDESQRDKYVIEFYNCTAKHFNLYRLIHMDQIDKLDVRSSETYFADKKRSELTDVSIDWSAWLDFSKNKGLLDQALQGLDELNPNDKVKPYWERFVALKKPPSSLVEVFAQVPVRKGNRELYCTYALDQDGLSLGYSRVDSESSSDTCSLGILLVPGMVKSVRICALYFDPEDDDTKKDVLHESKPISLAEVTK